MIDRRDPRATGERGLLPNSEQATGEVHGDEPVEGVDAEELEGLLLRDVLSKHGRGNKAESAYRSNEGSPSKSRPAGEDDDLYQRKRQDEVGNEDESHYTTRVRRLLVSPLVHQLQPSLLE